MLDMKYVAGMSVADVQGRRAWADASLARQFMYADCDDETAENAIRRLRPQAQSPYSKPCSLDSYPSVPTTYIVCSQDRLVNPAWSREFAITGLGAELVELPGSHSPFMSRPVDLADILDEMIPA